MQSGAAGFEERITTFSDKLQEAITRVQDWNLKGVDSCSLLRGFKKTYTRGCRAMNKAYKCGSAEQFHEWRKRTKYHWYHIRLLQEMWPQVMKAYSGTLHRLSNLLGDDHDLAVLSRELLNAPSEFGDPLDIEAFVGLAEQRRQELQVAALPLGKLLCRQAHALGSAPRPNLASVGK